MFLQTATGHHRPYHHGVVVAEPQHSKIWVADLHGAQGLHRLLHSYHEFHTRNVIHDDPIYVRDEWKLGSLFQAGHRTNVFTSWASRRM
ncbi:MAG: hypothetical protein M3Q07_15475 [Pseudobdellovibrionaceae bacterium]|nr:hypothetical protein [Pseudobdellovibrionaceae bacterium]